MTGGPRRRRPGPEWLVIGAVVVAAAALTGAMLAAFAPSVGMLSGLPDLGAVVDAGLPAARVLAVGAAAVVVGNLLLAAVLVPGEPNGTVSRDGYAGLQAARGWALVQCVASLAVALLTVAESAGAPPGWELTHLGSLAVGVLQLQQAAGWAISAVVALLVAVLATVALSWRTAVGLLVLALAALLPLALTQATNTERSHDLAGDAVALHVLGGVLWLGSTIAVVVHGVRRGATPDAVLRRHSAIATACLLLVGASGIESASLVLTPGEVLTSGYGLLVVVGAILLVGLAVVAHRVRLVVRARPGHTAARLVVLELVLLAGAAATGTGLMRLFPPSQQGYVASRTVYLIGYELPPHLTVADLLLRWRFDLVLGTLAMLAAAGYLLGVARLRRAGRSWPAGRTAAWLAGCAVLLVATSSGLGTYATAVFSVHMVQHMLLATLVPVLLVLGHGVTLILQISGERTTRRLLSLLDSPAVRLVRHPAVAWVAVALTLFGLYPTGLFAAILQQHWAHLAMDAAFLGTGLALFWPVLGHSLPGRGLPPIGRIVMVFAVMALHAVFSAWLLSRSVPVAESFYASLRLPYVPDLLADQRLGAELGWALGELPVVITVLALVLRWTRTDRATPEDADLVRSGLRPDDEMAYPDIVPAGSAAYSQTPGQPG